MKPRADQVLMGTDLGSVAGLQQLTARLAGVTAELASPLAAPSCAQLLELRGALERLHATMIKLRCSVHGLIERMGGGLSDAL
jgi:hypothetical protein